MIQTYRGPGQGWTTGQKTAGQPGNMGASNDRVCNKFILRHNCALLTPYCPLITYLEVRVCYVYLDLGSPAAVLIGADGIRHWGEPAFFDELL